MRHFVVNRRTRHLTFGAPLVMALAMLAFPFAFPFQVHADESQSVDFFETNVRPLLVNVCVECHGEREQAGNLRLDSRQHALAGGDSGDAIVPGDPGRSLMIKAVRRDGDLQMPPDHPLSDSQISKLADWIKIGAPWPETAHLLTPRAETHWSFQPVQRPAIPSSKLEDTGGTNWVGTPIDAFVLRRLLANGLHPSPRADRRTLIRRATFDLTGLPPTTSEVKAFLSDDSDDAWPRLIDRLLDSPHYGEKWARH